MKVLVTGASGFCGSHLISRLQREPGVEIAGLDRGAVSTSPSSPAQYFQADMCDRAAVESIVEAFAPDCVYHLAGASATSSASDSMYEVNVAGTVYLLEALVRRAPRCKVLLAGSAAEYGPVVPECLPVTETTPCRPIGAYGISKYAATLIGIDHFSKYGLKVVIARPSNIIGPGVPKTLVVGALLDRAQKALAFSDPEVKVGDSDSERDFVDVRDVVDAYIRLIQAGQWGQIFNISSGQPRSIGYIAEALLANSSRPIRIVYDSSFVPHSSIKKFYCSYEKADRAFGYQPSVKLEETLKACWLHEIGSGVACA